MIRTPHPDARALPHPAAADDGARDDTAKAEDAVSGVIERVIADVPAPRESPSADPDRSAQALARVAAQRAALVSGSLALPPGPLGLLTVLPDLFVIWKLQRQMVADIFALYGRTAELSRTHMLYCLFRHAASQALRDVAVRAGQRFVVRQMSSAAMRSALGSVAIVVTRRITGTSVTRWIPLAGAAAVAAYAYWDTLQVAKTARKLLADEEPPAGRAADGRAGNAPAT
jgi:hypothetical protein